MFKRLRSFLDSVQRRDPAARSYWSILLLYPGVHAVLWHRLTNWLWRCGLTFAARALSQLARWLTGIEIHPGATIGRNLFIDHGMGVVIGETAEIGDNVTLYHGVTLGGVSLEDEKRHPTIMNDVIIGAGAQVLGPVTVGSGARIGANAVVIRDVESYASIVGIPGRPVNKRVRLVSNDFAAYGLTSDEVPDPVSRALRSLESRIAELEAQTEAQRRDRCGGE